MAKLGKLFKKLGKVFSPITHVLGTGKSAAKRAAKKANAFAAEAEVARGNLEAKTKKEQQKAQKLAIRGLRSRRAASRFNLEGSPSYGSTTIG